MEEVRTLEKMTTCSECIKLSVVVPKQCRMDADMLVVRLRELFNREVFRGLCDGCPMERKPE